MEDMRLFIYDLLGAFQRKRNEKTSVILLPYFLPHSDSLPIGSKLKA